MDIRNHNIILLVPEQINVGLPFNILSKKPTPVELIQSHTIISLPPDLTHSDLDSSLAILLCNVHHTFLQMSNISASLQACQLCRIQVRLLPRLTTKKPILSISILWIVELNILIPYSSPTSVLISGAVFDLLFLTITLSSWQK